MPGLKGKHRSGCPVGAALDVLGDRWSLLIIRDLMVRGFRTFKEFQGSGEGIATNILADRLQRLESAGIVSSEKDPEDARRVFYRLTEKGIDLAPVLLELLMWGARYQAPKSAGPVMKQMMAMMAKDRVGFLAEVRRRWEERDLTPLIPKFGG